jgi:hypothetical protein
MTIKELKKVVEDRLFEGEITLQYFKDKGKDNLLIEEQERSINDIKEFLNYLEQYDKK